MNEDRKPERSRIVRRGVGSVNRPSFGRARSYSPDRPTTPSAGSPTQPPHPARTPSRPYHSAASAPRRDTSPHGADRSNRPPQRTQTRSSSGRGAPRGHQPRPFPLGSDTSGNGVAVPPIEDDVIRIIPLGGVEEVGRNMTVIETEHDIIIMDMGVRFSEDSTPGIDFILPNTKYLEERKGKIRGVIITHGHLDHIGAIPYLMDKIGNPPIYSRNFTNLMIRKRQEEFPHLAPLNIITVEANDRLLLGSTYVTLFGVTHSIPDAMGAIVETPYGDIVYTGDLRLDHTDGVPSETEEMIYTTFRDRNVLLLMTDSTNVDNPGFSISEHTVIDNIDEIIRMTTGRLIISTFASQVDRMLRMLEICEKYGKKVAVDGRSMKTNIEITKAANLLHLKKETFITAEEMTQYPEQRVVALVTGAQGEEFAALMRIANKTHKYIRLTPRDTILMSSSIIPGNERNVQKLKDNLSRQGAHIVHYKTSDIHASGHANHDELKWIHEKVHAKFFIPIHGYHYMLRLHTDLAQSLGTPAENVIIPDNGMVIEIYDNGTKIRSRKEFAPKNLILVDGFSVGDIQEVVIRDRQLLAQDGIFVIIAIVDTTTGQMRKSPDVISRGFVYLRDSQEMLRTARAITKKTIEDNTLGVKAINFDYVRERVTDAVSRYLFQETAKRPIVLPVILGV
ncbi:MAG: ribonuclease J [Minisyncoccota bacterium]